MCYPTYIPFVVSGLGGIVVVSGLGGIVCGSTVSIGGRVGGVPPSPHKRHDLRHFECMYDFQEGCVQ